MSLPDAPEEHAALTQRLLAWFDEHKRELPWREPRFRTDPYAVLVSEIMLQQTRVDTVVPYFLDWMDRWPTIQALAQATEEEVLDAWQGLGYYNRARRLHAATRRVVEDHEGQLPRDPGTLRQLPGIGPYTAAAVAALAFDAPTVAVDGNVARLWARLAGQGVDPADTKTKRRARTALAPLVPEDGRAGDAVEALIELGATVCTPEAPACPTCPLAQACTALAEDRVHEVPRPTERGQLPTREVVALLVERDGRVLVRKRPTDGLLGGLWGLPMAERAAEERVAETAARLVEGVELEDRGPVARVRHTFTHKRWGVRVHTANLPDQPPDGETWRWLAWDELDTLPRSRLDEKVAEALAQRRLDAWS